MSSEIDLTPMIELWRGCFIKASHVNSVRWIEANEIDDAVVIVTYGKDDLDKRHECKDYDAEHIVQRIQERVNAAMKQASKDEIRNIVREEQRKAFS